MLNSNFEQHAKKVLEKWGYTHIRKIGKGGFGHVVLVSKFFISMSFYAVKCFSLKNNTKDANLKRYIEQQVKIMHNIDHPNVVRFETSFQDSGWYFIVMEYCDMGNLLTYQSKIANKTLGLAKASKILLQILNGILTIHSQNIIHRDIKCENIFLKKNSKGNGYQCKIGDFGFAKQIDQYTRTSCGTTLFMAPQVLKKIPYSYEVDIWSIGVVFYFMIFGQYPFKSINIEKQIYDKCVNGFSLSQSVPAYKQRKQFAVLQDFFKRVFDLDQDRRIKLEDMIEHKIFRSGDAIITQDEMSDEVLDQNLQWALGKIKFIEDLATDLTNLKILDPYLLYSSRFYLYKVMASILKDQVLQQYPYNSNSKIGKELEKKEKIYNKNIQQQYENVSKFINDVKKINNFNQGYNLTIQDFYSMKEGYRNTLALVYSDIQKKIPYQNLKCQLKLRILCCHLINRVFGKSLKSDIFPNFNTWIKHNLKGVQLKKQSQFPRLNDWIQSETPQKLANEIESINKKFYC